MNSPDLSTLDAAETLLKESVPVCCGESAADWRSHLEATLRGVVRSVCRLSEEVAEVRQKLVFCERSVVALTAEVSSGGGGGGGGSSAHHRHEPDSSNSNYLPKLQEMQALLAGHSRIIAGLDRSLVDARAAAATTTTTTTALSSSPQQQRQQQPLPRLVASEPSPQRESKYFAPHQDPVPPKLYSSAQSGGGGGDRDAPATDGGGVPRTLLSQVRGASPASAAVGRQAAEPIGVPASTPGGRAQTPHRRAQQQQQQQWSGSAFFSSTSAAAGRPGALRTPPSRSSAAAAAAAADPLPSVSWGGASSWQGRPGDGAFKRGGSPEMF